MRNSFAGSLSDPITTLTGTKVLRRYLQLGEQHWQPRRRSTEAQLRPGRNRVRAIQLDEWTAPGMTELDIAGMRPDSSSAKGLDTTMTLRRIPEFQRL